MNKKLILVFVIFTILCFNVSALKIRVADNLGYGYDGILGGISGADNICNTTDPPTGSTWKALIGVPGQRYAGSAGWPLLPNTNYTRADGTTLIGTTNSNSCFPLPLNNSVETSSGLNGIWTGLNNDCTASAYNCGGWTSTGGDGTVGNNLYINDYLSMWDNPCYESLMGIYCVEQPQQQPPPPPPPPETIPEFSTIGLLLVFVIALTGFVMIKMKK